MHDTDQIEAAMRYHERTKHQFNRYADGPGQLDWANQPNPFRLGRLRSDTLPSAVIDAFARSGVKIERPS